MIKGVQDLGWADILQNESRETWEKSVEISRLNREDNEPYNGPVECLVLLLDDIFRVANDLCQDHIYRPQHFESHREHVFSLLERGIPPAEILDGMTENAVFQNIDAITIINGGWFFCEQGYPGWEERFGELDSIKQLDLLNRLIAKAVEITFVREAEN
jgi:hypothetical protein